MHGPAAVCARALTCRRRPQANLFRKIKTGAFKFESPDWDPISDAAKDMIRCGALARTPQGGVCEILWGWGGVGVCVLVGVVCWGDGTCDLRARV